MKRITEFKGYVTQPGFDGGTGKFVTLTLAHPFSVDAEAELPSATPATAKTARVTVLKPHAAPKTRKGAGSLRPLRHSSVG